MSYSSLSVESVLVATTSDADDWTREVVAKYGKKGFYILKGPSTIKSRETPAYLLEAVRGQVNGAPWVGWVEAKYLDLVG